MEIRGKFCVYSLSLRKKENILTIKLAFSCGKLFKEHAVNFSIFSVEAFFFFKVYSSSFLVTKKAYICPGLQYHAVATGGRGVKGYKTRREASEVLPLQKGRGGGGSMAETTPKLCAPPPFSMIL